jgi:phosphatidylglycerophosphate synthase
MAGPSIATAAPVVATPIRDALILAGPGATERVAGLANLDRLVLAALAAGMERVVAVAPLALGARAVLRPSSLDGGRVRVLEPQSEAVRHYLDGLRNAGRSLFLVETGIVLDQRAIREVAEAPRDNGTLLLARIDATSAALGVLPPDIAALLAEAEPTAEAVAAVVARARGEGRVVEYRVGTGHVAPLRTGFLADRRLMRSAAKPSDGPVSRYLNRPVSATVSAALARWNVPPDAVTWTTLVVSLLAAAALFQGRSWSFIVGTALFHLSSILDGCDGEIARIGFRASEEGARLDRIVDSIGLILVGLGAGIGLYRVHGDVGALWVAGFAAACAVPLMVVTTLKRRAENYHATTTAVARSLHPKSVVGRLVTALSNLYSRDVAAFVAVVLALLGSERLLVPYLGLGIVLYIMMLIYRAQLQRTAPA